MGAPAARVFELSRYWANAGHKVTVITGFPNHPTGRLNHSYRKKIRRGVLKESVAGVNVVRTWLLPFPNRRAYERILNYTSFCLSSAITGSFLSAPDVVIATSPQLLVGLSGWWIARLKSVPFVFEVRDLWPESLVAVGMGGETSLLHRLLGKLARFLYRKCDRLVVVTPAFKEYLVKQMGVAAEKISIVQNGVDTGLFVPKQNRDLRQDLCIEGKFVISYIGTLGNAHGLVTVLESAAQLQKSNPEMIFLFVGEGAERAQLATLANSRGLTNTRFIGEQPRETVPAFICASDVCLVALKKSEVFKTVIPTKMLEFMACSRPLILGVEGQARAIMEEAQAGIFIEPENPQELTEAILRLKGNAHLRAEMGRKGREYIVNNFSRRETADIYLQILNSLVAEGDASTPLAA